MATKFVRPCSAECIVCHKGQTKIDCRSDVYMGAAHSCATCCDDKDTCPHGVELECSQMLGDQGNADGDDRNVNSDEESHEPDDQRQASWRL